MGLYRGRDFRLSRVENENPRDDQYRLHVHDDYEILCLVSGNVGYLVEGHTYDLKPGSIMLMRRAESHRLVVKGGERYDRFTLNFRPELLLSRGLSEELLLPFDGRELGERNMYHHAQLGATDPLQIFCAMEDACETLGAETAVCAYLSALLCSIHAAYLRSPDGIASEARSEDPTGRAILEYVNENLCRELSLSSVSEAVHMSPSQINRIFHRLTGTSVYHYALSKRLVLAQRMIKGGETATAAAATCGFRDYSSFYRLYKKHFGHSPAEHQSRRALPR